MTLSVAAPRAVPLAEPVEAGLASRFRLAISARSAAAERRRREQELRHALMGGELSLGYDPRRSLKTGLIAAVEATIRWPHRRRGLVPTAGLMPVIERTGLAPQISGWLLQEACSAAAAWQSGTIVSIDLAGGQIDHDGLLDQVAGALETSRLPPERLEVGLSEADVAGCLDDQLMRLAALRDLGVGIAIDQLGAGVASLSVLRRLPLTAVKLDGSLLRDLTTKPEDRAIVGAIIQAAHGLGLLSIAASVETEAQRTILSGMACDAGQGPLFGQAFPADWPGDLPAAADGACMPASP